MFTIELRSGYNNAYTGLQLYNNCSFYDVVSILHYLCEVIQSDVASNDSCGDELLEIVADAGNPGTQSDRHSAPPKESHSCSIVNWY